MAFTYAPGATPLDLDEATGLLPVHITTQADLNAWEEANIVQADTWALRQKKRDLLDETFVRELHRKMFNKTWRWAGTFRVSNKNIGVDWTQVSVRLHNLLENTRYQMEHQVYATDELALRFHHQLVWIHAFPNGNGRHARVMADALITRLSGQRFSWGSTAQSQNMVIMSDIRTRYLHALRSADAGSIHELLAFARS